ncbi:MAG TPA: DNA-directed RNA polymerase subunit alpha C-terminal domain-containing protein [Streptosporangiaceae bacterium]|nr:DNA-directed RNA polymerase subunit alpha C-terminal domain-containing protein [Streptosporangiaceae bacterium]
MELEHSFTVPVPEDRAWDVLLDVERVAPCMPGASLDSVDGDEIKGRIKVKVGPIAMTYAGTARFTERDPQAHVITLEASGKETRGAGTASATVRSTLRGDNGETHVVVHTTLNVTGRPAQFGRGVMAEVGGKLIGIFASNLADMLAAERPAEPPAGQAQEQAPAGEQEGEPEQSLESLNLNVRSYNSLRREGIHTVPALAAQTREQLLAIDNIGPASVEEISQKLADRGLTLSDSPASRNGVPGPVAAAPAPAAAASAPAGATAAAPAGAAAPSAASDGHARSPGPAAASPATEPAWSPPADDGAINLLSVAGMPVLKRAIPVAAALAAAALIALRVRVKRRRARG